jgi:2-keto-4-pentenoate hydratase/2-oxohepta-3-ene-1,7-dioic acid hydratase in catechol pathway
MKLATFRIGDDLSYGVWREDGIVDLGRRLVAPSLAGLIAGGVEKARPFADATPDHAHADVVLEKPLLDWGKCFCVGVNYPERNEEYRDGSDVPNYPSLFVRFPESFTGPDKPLIRPPESPQLDYEGEIVLVIGKAGRRIAAQDWEKHICGYTIGNEGTIRDWVRHGKFNVTPGKNWASSGALGPWIATADAVDPRAMRIVTRVNGEVRQDDSTDRMIFSFGRIVEYVSTFCTLMPGDIIFTGTPAGAGARLDPPCYLVPGDRVEVEVSGLGILRNPIADEH